MAYCQALLAPLKAAKLDAAFEGDPSVASHLHNSVVMGVSRLNALRQLDSERLQLKAVSERAGVGGGPGEAWPLAWQRSSASAPRRLPA